MILRCRRDVWTGDCFGNPQKFVQNDTKAQKTVFNFAKSVLF